jgi:hypothetical protein
METVAESAQRRIRTESVEQTLEPYGTASVQRNVLIGAELRVQARLQIRTGG